MAYPYLSDVIEVLTAELLRQQKTAQIGAAPGSAVPEQIVPGLTIVVMMAGVAGARLFHIFQIWGVSLPILLR